jgi:uncharacterized protein (DUF2249 family)
MMETSCATVTERVIDMREITSRVRHTVVFQLFEHLDEARSFQLVVDHDPRPLRLQLEAKHGSRCRWTDLELGPDVWRVRLQIDPKTSQSCSAPNCCSARR